MKTKILVIGILCFTLFSCTTRKDGSVRYRTTSETMLPTISPGDYLLMDTTERKLQLDYGDIIRCSFYINGEKDYDIFRIIGLPGDSVAVHDNASVINGTICKNKYVKSGEYDIFEYRGYKEFIEVLPNEKEIYIHKSTYGRANEDELPTTQVPEKCYFVLGDARLLFSDSRYIGFIPQENIWGKLIKIEN